MVDRVRRFHPPNALPPEFIGFLAQGFTVSASLLPIIFGLEEALVYVVLVSSLVSVVINSAVLAAPLRLPAIEQADEAYHFIRAAVYVLTGLSGVLLLYGATGTLVTSIPYPSESLGTATLLLSQGAFTLLLSEAVRRLDVTNTMILRLSYGASLLPLTLVACLLQASGPGLLTANVASYAFAIGTGLWREPSILAALRESARTSSMRSTVSTAMVSSRALTLSFLIGGVPSQAGGLIVGGLGVFSPLWAVVIRLMSGFQTIGGYVLGPRIDVAIATAFRSDGDLGSRRQALLRSLLISALLAVLGVTSCIVAIWWSSTDAQVRHVDFVGFVIWALLFTGMSITIAPIGRIIGMVGHPRDRLIWDGTRAALTVLCLVFLSGFSLMMGLTIVTVFSTAHYVLLITRHLN